MRLASSLPPALWRRFLIAAAASIILISGLAGLTAPQALAAQPLCVGSGSGCYSTLQAAVDASHDGDTIRVGHGTFAGGVKVNVSITIVGAGAESTVLKGGQSVLTIGMNNAPSEPTVAISGVTITGGIAQSSPQSIPTVGVDGVLAAGGGIEIPYTAHGPGATLILTDSVVTGNRVAPSTTVPSGLPCPGAVDCPFASAAGGGIDSWGVLTLVNTTVSHNLVGSASGLSTIASDAEGAGIFSHSTGSLRIKNSTISDNHASASAPNGRNVDSGGVLAQGATLTVDNSSVTDNTADLSAALPTNGDIQEVAMAGGIHVSGNTSGRIRNTTISGNHLSATNSVGDAVAFSGGLHSDGSLMLSNDRVSDNSVTATAPFGSSGSAVADSGAGELNGTSQIRDTRFTGNSVSVRSSSGTASATAGAFVSAGDPRTLIRDSVINDNRLSATTTTGSAIVHGGGIVNIALLTLQNTAVRNNTATTHGPNGIAQGGGIWNSPIPGGPPTTQLTLINSTVNRNSLKADPGSQVQGGGIYTAIPVTLTRSKVSKNVPDQCFGC
jgi:hypothetical protein